MDVEIHQLEQKAYTSVLRAFRAQSDAVTWEKKSLIAKIRKELRVSDDEHRELSAMVNADDTVCRIREWRQGDGHDLLASPTTSSHKKQKISRSASLSHGMLIHDFHSQPVSVSMQQKSLPPTESSGFQSGGRTPKPGQLFSEFPSMRSTQRPITGPSSRGQLSHRSSSSAVLTNEHSEAAIRDPLVGRKVTMRWPEDNNFYEAVITDYNPNEGRHALVYDIKTPKETRAWVDLKEISSEDIRWVGEDPVTAFQRGLRMSDSLSHGVAPGARRERGLQEDQSYQSAQLQNGVGRESDEIEILDTNTLIKEVEKVIDTSHLDLLEIEKAKIMLKEHEQAQMSVIEKLADEFDTESDGDHYILEGHPKDGGPRDINSLD